MALKFPKPRIERPRLETFDRGHVQANVYRALPSPITAIYGAIISGSITGLAWIAGSLLKVPKGDHNGENAGFWWAMTAMAIMTVIALGGQGWRYLRSRKGAKSQEQFEEAVRESAGGAADEVNDPAEIARVDNLRQKFEEGIKTFRDYGKDFYSLPWYVIVGEPGAGKTEAIRNSHLRFPERLNDLLQGAGGTYSMNWWFTNHAVLLDTAGAMFMNPEAEERFEVFLRLLRSYRPDCPINGLILALPVDSLLIDDPARTEEKARTIASQLDVIQRALDVRFPIYLLVTKSDRLPGFREFFDAEGQQKFQHEMVGWSNPDSLDSMFQPDRVYEALDAIATRLRARRLALLADPIPTQPGVRRIDEVDALYTFPEVILSLGDRLERYLRVIFQSGAWQTWPPFFRGLYFTSALREGAALDEELASALGMPVDSLPSGGIWDRQKSLHLRDTFLEKIFRETGLVTRLTDIAGTYRRRLFWLLGTSAAILLALSAFFWHTQHSITEKLKIEQPFWQAGSQTWDNGRFLSIIEQVGGHDQGSPLQFAYKGEDRDRGLSQSRIDTIKKANEYAKEPLTWVFKPVPAFGEFEDNRRAAARTLFEGGVMKPLVDAAREKLWWDAQLGFEWWPTISGAKPTPSDIEARVKQFRDAFKALGWLGCTVDPKQQVDKSKQVDKNSKEKVDKFTTIIQTQFFVPILKYILAGDIAIGENKILDIAKKLAELSATIYTDDFPLSSRTWLSPDPNQLGKPGDVEKKAIEFLASESGKAKKTREEYEAKTAVLRDLVSDFNRLEDGVAGKLSDLQSVLAVFPSLRGGNSKLQQALQGLAASTEREGILESINDITEYFAGLKADASWTDQLGRQDQQAESPILAQAQACAKRFALYEKNLPNNTANPSTGMVPDLRKLLEEAAKRAAGGHEDAQEVEKQVRTELERNRPSAVAKKPAGDEVPEKTEPEESLPESEIDRRTDVAVKIIVALKTKLSRDQIREKELQNYAHLLINDLASVRTFPFVKGAAPPRSSRDDLRKLAQRWLEHKRNLEDFREPPEPPGGIGSAIQAAYLHLQPLFEVMGALFVQRSGSTPDWAKIEYNMIDKTTEVTPQATGQQSPTGQQPRLSIGWVPRSAVVYAQTGVTYLPAEPKGQVDIDSGLQVRAKYREKEFDPPADKLILSAEFSKDWALLLRIVDGRSKRYLTSNGGEVTIRLELPGAPDRWATSEDLLKAQNLIRSALPPVSR